MCQCNGSISWDGLVSSNEDVTECDGSLVSKCDCRLLVSEYDLLLECDGWLVSECNEMLVSECADHGKMAVCIGGLVVETLGDGSPRPKIAICIGRIVVETGRKVARAEAYLGTNLTNGIKVEYRVLANLRNALGA